MPTIRELLSNGQFRNTPITELIELMSSELTETMDCVEAINQCLEVSKSVDRPARVVRKSVRPVRQAVAVEVCPFHDHESESNCHGIGEVTQSNPNDVMDSLFKYYL